MVRFVPSQIGVLTVLYIAVTASGAIAGAAGAPYCNVTETCSETSDNCTPATGKLTMQVQPSGKARVTLNDADPLESTVLDLNGVIVLIFHDDNDEHQLRIAQDGKFNYLITKPDPSAHNGKDQVLYRGQCVEG